MILYLELPFHIRNSLRISNHFLRIETGRFSLTSLSIEDRKLYLCEDAIENELHLLFDCDCYYELDEHKDMLVISTILSRIYLIFKNGIKYQ